MAKRMEWVGGWGFRGHVALGLFLVLSIGQSAQAGGPWWNTQWRYRVPLDVSAASVARVNKPADASVNFTQALTALGQSGSLDPNSLRVVEVDGAGNVLNASVAFQFDRDADYNAATKASGTMVLIMEGNTSAGVTRHYHVYFETTGGSFTPPSVAALVTMTDNVFFEGQSSYQIVTPSATYYYHKQGAAFAGIKDKDNVEWLGYHPDAGSGSGGEYRGVPNLVYNPPNPGYFHPGFTNSSSRIVAAGPVKLTINSKSTDLGNPWECQWEMYPSYARMTLLVTGNSSYWFLVEGIPGGSYEAATDFVVRSNGVRTPASDSWSADIPAPEWLYFGDGGTQRVFYAVHHEDDALVDTYRPQTDAGGSMTVFGFARDLTVGSYFTTAPQHFTIGFAEDSTYSLASNVIAGAFRDVTVTAGAPEQFVLQTPGLISPQNNASGVSSAESAIWNAVPGATGYQLQVGTDPAFVSGIAIDEPNLADTSRVLSGLGSGTGYYWRVRAKNAGGASLWSATWAFSTASSAAPALVSPANGAVSQPTTVSFQWSSVIGASRYHLQLDSIPSFIPGTLVKDDSSIVDTTRPVAGLAGGKTFYWRVRAHTGTSWGPFTSVWSFRTFGQLPAQVSLVSPATGSIVSADSVRLRWNKALPGVTRYWVEVSVDSTFQTFKTVDSTVTDTTKVERPLLNGRAYYWRVRARNIDGWGLFSAVRRFNVVITDIAPVGGQLPEAFQLMQNYPNPFNPSTQIAFALPTDSHVRLEVYNVLGGLVATLVDERVQAGYHTAQFNASGSLSSGTYFVRMTAGALVFTRRMVLMK